MPANTSKGQDTQIYRKYMRTMLNTYQNRQDIRVFTEILLTSATAVVFILFAIKPTLTTISNLYTEMNVKIDTITTMDTKIANLQTAEALYHAETQKISLLNSAIPSSPIPEKFIRQVEGIAQQSSVTLTGLTIGDINIIKSTVQPSETTNQEIPVTITVSGTYPNLLSFLSNIESMRRPILTQSGNITLGSEISDNQISLTLIGQIPYVPAPSENNTL